MKAISIVMHSALAAALIGFAAPAPAADDFVEACILSAPTGGDMAKTCACMSTKIPADVRADAAEALRRSSKAMSDTSKSIDPSTLPPNLMKGLQAAVLAQADCM
jgi:hypothetical protein